MKAVKPDKNVLSL